MYEHAMCDAGWPLGADDHRQPGRWHRVRLSIDRETFAAEARTHDRLARGRHSFLCHPAAGSSAPPPRRGV
jgi:hypothetical protein